MPIGNPINTNDIKSNRMHQEPTMSSMSNNESTIGQPTQQQQQQQQYLSQNVQPLVPVSYQYVVPEQWPYPQYYQPVSYTHLDVYKRQVLCLLINYKYR